MAGQRLRCLWQTIYLLWWWRDFYVIVSAAMNTVVVSQPAVRLVKKAFVVGEERSDAHGVMEL